MYGFAPKGRQSSQIFAFFLLIFPVKHLKCNFRLGAYTAQRLHCRMFLVMTSCSGKSKGVRFACGVSLRRLVGELKTPKLTTFSPTENVHSTLAHYPAGQIWTKDGLERVIAQNDVYFGM